MIAKLNCAYAQKTIESFANTENQRFSVSLNFGEI